MTLTVGSLFSGIGGIELGLEWTGHFRTRWQVENGAYVTKIITGHWLEVTHYGNIQDMDWHTVEPVDVLCGGFPCQPVSLAGKRLAQRDPRWLWPWMAEAVRLLRPRYVLVENTPGLLGAGMGDVLGDLAASGYAAEWQSLTAAAFGAPHIRERVFIVAYPDSLTGLQENSISRPVREDQNAWDDACRISGSERAELGYVFGSPPPRFNWPVYPSRIIGVADGFPHRVDRMRALGNAVVPQMAQWIGEQLWRFHQEVTLHDA